MNQYYVILKSSFWEYVFAYGYKIVDGRYVFDIGHGNTYVITESTVKSIELLKEGTA